MSMCASILTSASTCSRCPAGHREHVDALVRIDAHIDIYVGQQLQFIVVDLAEQLADAARLACHHLLWNYLRFAHPSAIRQRVPGDLDRLARFEAAELGLVDKGTHPDLVEVGHLGKQG